MAGQVLKRRRLANPRRKLSPKQIRFFGTQRQKAALRRRRNAGPRFRGLTRKVTRALKKSRPQAEYYYQRSRKRFAARSRNQGAGITGQVERAAVRAVDSVERAAEDAIRTLEDVVTPARERNVGQILTVMPANPARKRRRNMAATAVRRRRRTHRVSNRRRANPARRRRRNRAVAHRRHGRRNPAPRVVVRYRNRRRMHNRRRRNQGGAIRNFLSGDAGKVVGILGGAMVTNIVTGFLPATWKSGIMGSVVTGVTAVVVGQVAGRALSNRSLGNWMTVGGLLIVGLQLVNQFFPTLALPFTTTGGTSGMGLISGSNFYVPQVNMPGSMASFVTPAGIPAPVVLPAGGSINGLGAQPIVGLRSLRRVGRMR